MCGLQLLYLYFFLAVFWLNSCTIEGPWKPSGFTETLTALAQYFGSFLRAFCPMGFFFLFGMAYFQQTVALTLDCHYFYCDRLEKDHNMLRELDDLDEMIQQFSDGLDFDDTGLMIQLYQMRDSIEDLRQEKLRSINRRKVPTWESLWRQQLADPRRKGKVDLLALRATYLRPFAPFCGRLYTISTRKVYLMAFIVGYFAGWVATRLRAPTSECPWRCIDANMVNMLYAYYGLNYISNSLFERELERQIETVVTEGSDRMFPTDRFEYDLILRRFIALLNYL